VLKHRHSWVATQHIQMDVSQQISVINALEQAEQRVIDVQMTEKLVATAQVQRV
jgi:hypothetical protein